MPQTSTRFDAIIIGTGQAGPSLAGRLTAAGLKTAVLERKRFGGTCVNNGCIPTKTLVASARAAWVARRAADWGVNIAGPVAVDMKRVKERKDAVVRRSNEGLGSWLSSMANCTVYRGHGRFVGPRQVEVNGEILEADKVFINVGARATIPNVRGLDSVPHFDNSTIMDVDFVPEHLLILGGGYIALEFAQMYRRFGAEVTVIQRGERLLTREDDDISATIREILERESVRVLSATCDYCFERRDGRIDVRLSCGGKAVAASGTHLLVATGRTPNTQDLGCEAAGIEREASGVIKVDDELRTSAPGVWALGECNGRGAFTHTSYNDFEIVAANLLDHDRRRVSDRIPAYALYIDPPLGRAGMTETEVRASGRPALIGKRPMSRVGRAVEKGETQGFMKVLVDAETKRILGAAILGIEGDEAIHSILDVMYAQAPYTVIQRAVHIHPTVTELIPTVLGELRPL